MLLSKEKLTEISSEKELSLFLRENGSIDLEDFKKMPVDNIFDKNYGIRENNAFKAYAILEAISQKNEFLIKALLNKDNVLETPVGFTPSSYSINGEVRNTVVLKNIINDKNFYQVYGNEELNLFFKILNNYGYQPYKNIKFKSVFQDDNFIRYGLPIVLKNRCENLLQSMLLPLLNEFNKSAISAMKNNSWSDISFLFSTIKKNKKELYEKIPEAGSVYDQNRMMHLLKDGYTALSSFLSPNVLYETLLSTTKKNQAETIEKIDTLLSLCDKLSSHAKGNILFESEENALRLDKDNVKSHSKSKNTPFALAVDKELHDVMSLFEKHGYEVNNIEKRYIELKRNYKDNNLTSTKIEQFIAISHEKGKNAYKKFVKFIDGLSANEKAELFEELYKNSSQKEFTSPNYYSIDVSDKTIRQESEKYSLVSYVILNNSIEMIMHLLDNGYKLSPAEFGLMTIPMSKLSITPLEPEKMPAELIYSQLVNHLKKYPESHKKIFLENISSREISKIKKNKTTNRSIDFYTYEILNNEVVYLNERERQLIGFRLKNKSLPPMIMSHFLENDKYYGLIGNSKIDWADYTSKLRISVLLSLPFFRIPEIKENYLDKVEHIISATEDIYPDIKIHFANMTDEKIREIYANSIAKKEKKLIMSSLSDKLDKNDNKRRL